MVYNEMMSYIIVLEKCEVYSTKKSQYSFCISLNLGQKASEIVGEPKSRIVQKHTFFALERYTARILYTK